MTSTDKYNFYHTLTVESVASHFNTNLERGLTIEEAQTRLEKNGPNLISIEASTSLLQIIFHNIFNPMNLVVSIAAVFSGIVGDFVQFGVLLAVIVTNSSIGILPEYKSEDTMNSLRRLCSPTARVTRRMEVNVIPAKDIVVGDIVNLQVGDVVPADLRLVEAVNLETDEALLTGESVPVQKHIDPIVHDGDCPIGDRKCIAYASTTVVKGRGKGIVVATAMDTQMGELAMLVDGGKSGKWFFMRKSSKTPLQKSLERMMYLCLLIACLLGVIVFGASKWKATEEVIFYAIAVAIAIIPEGLPAVVTITMAVGVRGMALQKAIVRRLNALEGLGNVTNVCSDKTGTLTEGKMVVKQFWFGNEEYSVTGKGIDPVGDIFDSCEQRIDPLKIKEYPPLYQGLLTCVLCCTCTLSYDEDEERWKSTGAPTEVALLVAGTKMNIKQGEHLDDKTFLAELPFDQVLKRMTTMYMDSEGNLLIYSKGAMEPIFEISSHFMLKDGTCVGMTDEFKHAAEQEMVKLAAKGYRVLAMAVKSEADANLYPLEESLTGSTCTGSVKFNREDVEKNFCFIGFAAMYDPPRQETAPSIQECKKAGIVVHMATGDHPKTAEAIAKEIGILTSDLPGKMVMTASEFDAMQDEELDQLAMLPLVLARCSPHSKVRLIEALHRRDKFVAMTGDGVNDAPAVQRADIGIAMGISGADVTKNASAMTLTDDNFKTIVLAIREGRRLFANSSKLALHLLSGNVSEVIALIFGLAIRDDNGFPVFPMSPIQILWLNMVTSSPVAAALGMEKASDDIMDQPPRKGSSLWTKEFLMDTFFYGVVMGMISLGSFLLVVGYQQGLTFLHHECNHSDKVECIVVFRARGVAFYIHSLLLLLHGYNCRHSKKSILTQIRAKDHNKYLNWAVLFGFVLVIPTAYLGRASRLVFYQARFGFEWIIVVPFVLLFLIVSECYKIAKRFYCQKRQRSLTDV